MNVSPIVISIKSLSAPSALSPALAPFTVNEAYWLYFEFLASIPLWPYVLSPHTYTTPSCAKAAEFLAPAATLSTPESISVELVFTSVGVYAVDVPPIPSLPFALLPNAQTWPSVSTASIWVGPAAMCLIFSRYVFVSLLTVLTTCTGDVLLTVDDVLPSYVLPHVQTVPSAFSAYTPLFVAATIGTVIPSFGFTKTVNIP